MLQLSEMNRSPLEKDAVEVDSPIVSYLYMTLVAHLRRNLLAVMNKCQIALRTICLWLVSGYTATGSVSVTKPPYRQQQTSFWCSTVHRDKEIEG